MDGLGCGRNRWRFLVQLVRGTMEFIFGVRRVWQGMVGDEPVFPDVSINKSMYACLHLDLYVHVHVHACVYVNACANVNAPFTAGPFAQKSRAEL